MGNINIMVNGLPGNVASLMATRVAQDPRFFLVPFSLTGPEIETPDVTIEGQQVGLIRPEASEAAIADVKADYPGLICVDYTHPTAVDGNVDFYCRHQVPFVMGTTGGNRERIPQVIETSGNTAVVAPNMAKQIVGLQAMLEWASENFPGLFTDYELSLEESHQAGKADTSGTAKAMVGYFNRMGIPFEKDQIAQIRDPQVQENHWRIPAEYLSGHAWHTYHWTSADKTAVFGLKHNVNGREIYVQGTLDAVVYLQSKIDQGVRSKMFTMIDVLKRN